MLRGQLIHPGILNVLGKAGHGSQILISDGNFPHLSALSPRAELINLNLSPGMVSCTDVLSALVSAVPFEKASVMQYATDGPYALSEDPPIWAEYSRLLKTGGHDEPLDRIERFAFYDAARDPNVVLTVATGEQRLWANLLLTVGVVVPPTM